MFLLFSDIVTNESDANTDQDIRRSSELIIFLPYKVNTLSFVLMCPLLLDPGLMAFVEIYITIYYTNVS